MTGKAETSLLATDDPSPVRVENPEGASLFLLLGDHAGNRVPRRLGNLGLDQHDLQRHIALDIGISRLGRALAARLDAPFVEQRYSRLVIDCNRATDAADSIAEQSDGTIVPANRSLSPEDRQARQAEVFAPYHHRIAAMLKARDEAGSDTVLISLHSFTPTLGGTPRPWDIGVLHDGGDNTFALGLLERLGADGAWRIGDNQPYRMDQIDYTVPRHAHPQRRRYAELEVRQDRLEDDAGVTAMVGVLAKALVETLESVGKVQ